LLPGPERRDALGLHATADRNPARGCPSGQLLHQPRLADARLPGDEEDLPDAGSRPIQRGGQLRELVVTPDERERTRDGTHDAPAAVAVPAGSIGVDGEEGEVRPPFGARRRGSCRRMAASSSCRAGEGSIPSSSASKLPAVPGQREPLLVSEAGTRPAHWDADGWAWSAAP
jgi:hypothetical protein